MPPPTGDQVGCNQGEWSESGSGAPTPSMGEGRYCVDSMPLVNHILILATRR